MTEPREPGVTVVIPARNAAATLPRTLDALARQTIARNSFEVVLVDDRSSDDTAVLATASPAVDRVIAGGGAGPARARNAGAAAARAPRLAFLDADCTPSAGWLAAGLAALDSAELVLGEVRPVPGEPLGPYDRTLTVVGVSPLFESANLFVRRELFDRLGGFDSWLGQHTGKELGEDVLFGWRARRAGARIAAAPAALVHHAIFPRGPGGYVAERARLRFFPALAGRVPELRDEFFYARVFLNRRSALCDAAFCGLAAAAGAAAARRPALAAAGLAAAIPYARLLRADLAEGRRRGGGSRAVSVGLLAARVAADLVGAGALAAGSLRARSLLL